MPLPLLAGIATGLIGAGASALSSFQQAKVARENTDKTIAANKAMAEYQYSKDIEMWNRGNAYNDPTAQMERLKKAGLNPNLVYGQGVTGNASGQLPKYNAPTMNYNYRPAVDPLSMIGAYQDFRIKQAETNTREAEARYADRLAMNQAALMSAKATSTGQDVSLKANQLGWELSQGPNDKISKYNTLRDTQLQALQNTTRQQQENILNTLKSRELLKANTQYRQLEIDNFLTNMWSKIIYGGAGTIARFK